MGVLQAPDCASLGRSRTRGPGGELRSCRLAVAHWGQGSGKEEAVYAEGGGPLPPNTAPVPPPNTRAGTPSASGERGGSPKGERAEAEGGGRHGTLFRGYHPCLPLQMKA